MPAAPVSFDQALDALSRRVLGGPASSPQRLTGGASQEIWAFDVPGAAERRLILRRLPPGDRMDRRDTVPIETEAAVIAAAAAGRVPVPAVRYVLRPEDGLGRGYVMSRVEGEAMGRRIVDDPAFAAVRSRLAAQCGAALAAIHAVPVGALPPLPERSPATAIDLLEAQLRSSDAPRPVFEAALVWLRRNRPADTVPALVHGDFRTGNFLVGANGLAAVLDWEACHVGDPVADLGWLCMPVWRFGRLDLAAGGFATRAELIAGYGREVAPSRLRFWEVFGVLRWGLTCAAMATAFVNGERSIERAAVGRRASEAEIELVHALTGGAD